MKDAKQIGGVRLVTADIGEAGADALRSLCDKALESGDDIIAVFAGKNAEKAQRRSLAASVKSHRVRSSCR